MQNVKALGIASVLIFLKWSSLPKENMLKKKECTEHRHTLRKVGIFLDQWNLHLRNGRILLKKSHWFATMQSQHGISPKKKIWFDDITYAPRGHEKVYDSHNVAVLEECSRILSHLKMARERAERSNWRGGLSWLEGRYSYFGRFEFPSGVKGGNTSLSYLLD